MIKIITCFILTFTPCKSD